MYKNLFVLFILCKICSCENSNETYSTTEDYEAETLTADPPQLDDRIVGGSPANIIQLPYQVSLQYKGEHICGASIIHPNYILTAAHCIEGFSPNKFRVRTGSSYTTGGGVLTKVCSIKKHNSYNKHNQNNDIALLQLCKSLPIGDGIQVVALPNFDEKLRAGSVATVSGWGYSYEGAGQTTRTLHQVQVPLVEKAKCKNLYRGTGTVTDNMLCAGETAQGGKDSCQGDSGGPLVQNGKLIGVVSWGYGCARPRYPGVYTRVSKYRNWIRSNSNV